MHICFIEDTPLYGGTQIWVTEAVRYFLSQGDTVTLLAQEHSPVIQACADTQARLKTYHWERVTIQDRDAIEGWVDALSPADVAVCTVHPPRNGFHPSIFAACCIKDGCLGTHLVTKTGTIVPDYKREYYLPDASVPTSVLAIAGFTRRYLIQNYRIPAEKVTLIYQGTDIERFNLSGKSRTQSLNRYQMPGSASPVLGCIGSFEERKGQFLLLEVLSTLVRGPLPDAHLLLVGDGPDEGELKSQVKRSGLESKVSFYPFTRSPETIYPVLDITVLPSLNKEGLPNVLLESLAMGVPAVASDLGGVGEAVVDGGTGYLVSPGSVEQLVDAIHRLWTDQDIYKQMQDHGRDFVVKKFNKKRLFQVFRRYFKAITNP